MEAADVKPLMTGQEMKSRRKPAQDGQCEHAAGPDGEHRVFAGTQSCHECWQDNRSENTGEAGNNSSMQSNILKTQPRTARASHQGAGAPWPAGRSRRGRRAGRHRQARGRRKRRQAGT